MKTKMAVVLAVSILLAAFVTVASAQQAPDRTVLPIQEPKRPVYTELDVRNAKMPPHFEVKAPAGAPNVVIVLIDDLGFGATETFGGPIPTPTLERLAQNGLRYNNFHTTALCSPTRAALKSGRNHHTVNMGFITEMATGFPGATGQIPNATAPLAEMLRLNGYSTAAFGKWHETAAWETSVSGPFDRWPTHQGFDKFYGFIGGETNQWAPYLYDGVTQVELPNDPNYHFMTDMTDKAVAWIKYQKAMTPDKPFFVYFAPGADPRAAPRAAGMDRQVEGQVRPGLGQAARGDPRPADQDGRGARRAPSWRRSRRRSRTGTSSRPTRSACSRAQAEVFAAYLDYTDHEIGRMLKAVEDDRPGRQHPGFLHRRRQRHQRRRRRERHVQRVHLLQRRAGEGRGHAEDDGQVGRPRDLPAHGGRLGGGLQLAVRLDEAGGLGLRRHPQRHGRVTGRRASRRRTRSARSSAT